MNTNTVPDSDLPDSIVPDSDMPTAAPAADGPGAVVGLVNDTGRAAQLAYRGIVTGAAGIPQAALDAANSVNVLNPHSAVSRAFTTGVLRQPDPGPNPVAPDASEPYTPRLSDFVHPEKWQQAAEFFADKAGLPKPTTDADKVLYKGAQAAPYAITAPEALIPGAVSSFAGGAASEATRQAGGGIGAQIAAGLAAGSVPALGTAAAGLTRTIARGAGSDAAAAMQGRMADAAASGATLTAGQAGGSRVVQALENTSGRLWGGGSVAKNAERQTAQLESSVNDIVDNLSPKGTALTPTGAGESINKGVAATKQSMKRAEDAAYAKVDQLVPETAPMNVSASAQKAADLAVPTSNEALNAATVSPKIKAVNDALAASGGTMPYADLTKLRTHVGSMIDRSFAPADPQTNGALKQLYGSLTEDLHAGAGAVSPEAQAAVKAAGTLYKGNKAQRDALNAVVNRAGGPEAVFQAATGQTKAGATKIGAVLSALDPENANVVRATVLHRMGRAVPSVANPAGEFNASTLLTNWNKMSPEAKDAVFGSSGAAGDLRKSLDSITKTVGTLRDAGHTLANPSGSAGAAAHGFELWKLLEVGGGVLAGAGGGWHALAGAAGAIPANMILSRALVNPRTARWIATTTKLPQHAIPNAVNQLAKMGKVDPDARDLAAALQGQQGGAP